MQRRTYDESRNESSHTSHAIEQCREKPRIKTKTLRAQRAIRRNQTFRRLPKPWHPTSYLHRKFSKYLFRYFTFTIEISQSMLAVLLLAIIVLYLASKSRKLYVVSIAFNDNLRYYFSFCAGPSFVFIRLHSANHFDYKIVFRLIPNPPRHDIHRQANHRSRLWNRKLRNPVSTKLRDIYKSISEDRKFIRIM